MISKEYNLENALHEDRTANTKWVINQKLDVIYAYVNKLNETKQVNLMQLEEDVKALIQDVRNLVDAL